MVTVALMVGGHVGAVAEWVGLELRRQTSLNREVLGSKSDKDRSSKFKLIIIFFSAWLRLTCSDSEQNGNQS